MEVKSAQLDPDWRGPVAALQWGEQEGRGRTGRKENQRENTGRTSQAGGASG